jgi:hypothetical protein
MHISCIYNKEIEKTGLYKLDYCCFDKPSKKIQCFDTLSFELKDAFEKKMPYLYYALNLAAAAAALIIGTVKI